MPSVFCIYHVRWKFLLAEKFYAQNFVKKEQKCARRTKFVTLHINSKQGFKQQRLKLAVEVVKV